MMTDPIADMLARIRNANLAFHEKLFAHPDFGEGVTAAVVLEPGANLSESDIIGALKPRLAGYKIPKRVVFVGELPRNAMGKVRKNALRARYSALYRAA